MKCPSCKDDLLRHETLELNIPAYRCGACNGVWLSSNDYLEWLKQQPRTLPEQAAADIPVPDGDSDSLKLCADCGKVLIRYRVLPNINFYLDHCGNCNGVWFDNGEWDVLVARNLLGRINQFFTKPWQTSMQEEETKTELDKLYSERFGPADYERIKGMWRLLKDHPHRAMMLAYLQAEDPYKV